MAGGKWIEDLHADTPVADAARHVLTVRLEVVRDYLPKALHEADKDPENVHQLRVGTRRAGAALRIFKACLPEKAHARARKRLRKLRRAAGAARDWDVFLLALADWPVRSEKQQAGFDFLAGQAMGQRLTAQERLREVCADEPFDFDRLLGETVAAVQRPADDDVVTLTDLARPLLSGLLHDLDEAVGRDLEDYGNLHQVRIAGKRLRYAMEVFAACFADRFRQELYPAVEEMQEVLGRANDSHVAGQRLEGLRDRLRLSAVADWKRFRPGLDALLRFHRQRLPKERQRFLAWWQGWLKSGSEDLLSGLVGAPA
jgi:CHAD domain-containing protein